MKIHYFIIFFLRTANNLQVKIFFYFIIFFKSLLRAIFWPMTYASSLEISGFFPVWFFPKLLTGLIYAVRSVKNRNKGEKSQCQKLFFWTLSIRDASKVIFYHEST
jgi:glucan phosphoethanolaminetransferase (alkaline phosphatase superfamily)